MKPRFNDLDSGADHRRDLLWYDGDSWKTGVSAKVSHFADNFMGASHDFKFGVQYNEGGHDYAYGFNDYIYTYSGVPAYGYTQLPFHMGGKQKTIGVYADDTVRVSSRLTLNLGLRFDNSRRIRGLPDPRQARQRDGPEHGGERRSLHLELVSPRARLQLQADRGRQDGPEGPLRPLLPRHHHPGVRRRRALRDATLSSSRGPTTAGQPQQH